MIFSHSAVKTLSLEAGKDFVCLARKNHHLAGGFLSKENRANSHCFQLQLNDMGARSTSEVQLGRDVKISHIRGKIPWDS